MQLRKATPDDYGFLCETFLRSVRAVSTHVEGLTNARVVSLITTLIDRGWDATVAESEGYLCGWIVFRPVNNLGWIFVREEFRRPTTVEGFVVADELLRHAYIDTTSRIVTPFLPNRGRKRWLLIHRPFECLP